MLRYGFDLAQMQSGLRRELERALRFFASAPAGSPIRVPNVKDPEKLLDFLVAIVPPMKAIALTITSLVNLWLAAQIVRLSGRLKRPWPTISHNELSAIRADRARGCCRRNVPARPARRREQHLHGEPAARVRAVGACRGPRHHTWHRTAAASC